ncbi:peroxisomal-coenzyme A synthetase [Purpureocillium lilacinum]|uniref:Peroxisomal-coenzyme A synthetase n=1 Tax=Purpureocillium lilacinum TaxID=33203 RepID=A0A179GCW8_PURLI|nr:peroxisomal-coenzyme A synthetase [Purpureocillium lilacinum]
MASTAASALVQEDTTGLVEPPAPISLETLPDFLATLYNLPPTDGIRERAYLRAVIDFARLHKDLVLARIAEVSRPSRRALRVLHTLLTEVPGPWPTLALLRCHARLSKSVLETTEVGHHNQSEVSASATASLVKSLCGPLTDLIRRTASPALRTPSSDSSISHTELREFATNFRLPVLPTARKPVVAVALPNGPLLAATCIAVATWYTAAPVNPAAGPVQFQRDIVQIGAKFILTTASLYESLELDSLQVEPLEVQILCMQWDGGGRIKLVTPSGDAVPPGNSKPRPNQADDVSLVLFTSGTTGTRKVVPVTFHSLIAGVVLVVDSWGLSSEDICVNMMPLYHVCMPISTPPLDYRLDRDGTSGVSIGPELKILDPLDAPVPAGTVGRICVRGTPVFPGYLLPDGSLDKTSFTAEGWFDTGDRGHVDGGGYLFITGRSKEVINRGGELISPFEVEDAIMAAAASTGSAISGRITQALAFPAAHDVLQEVVAVVLVTPTGTPRVDLRGLQLALRSSLQQAKWPTLIVYMDDVPRINNKPLRIQMWERLGLPTVREDMDYLRRHWQASCPSADTPTCVSIGASPVSLDASLVSAALDALVPAGFSHHCREHEMGNGLDIFVAPALDGAGDAPDTATIKLRQQLSDCLHNYMLPERIHVIPQPLPRNAQGQVDEVKLRRILSDVLGQSLGTLDVSTEGKVAKIFADLLTLAPRSIPPDVDFFVLGGDSLRAGRLISALRSSFKVQVPVTLVFNHGTVRDISAYLDKEAHRSSMDADPKEAVNRCATVHSSTSPWLMALQLTPLGVVYPMRRAFQWTVFITALSLTQKWSLNDSVVGRLVALTMCILCSRIITRILAPLVGIATKWLIIGRYREGLYPMWGGYHTRWWMVDKIVAVCGEGFFGTNDVTRRIYCRLMGARIGANVKLASAALGEWDLLDIRDGAELSQCLCRPFAVEANTSMYLGAIVLGENSTVGVSSIVAPGTAIPPNTCIGPNSSSWELADADEANRDLTPDRAPRPHWVLVALLTTPLRLLAWLLSLLPWAAGLVGMVLEEPRDNDTPLRNILDWFTAAERVGYHFLALLLRTFLSPFLVFGFVVLIRVALDACLGKLGPGPAGGRGAVATWRAAAMKTLMPVSRLRGMTTLFGQHYEATSVALRLLGSRVGERVYWPGTGPEIGDYHLLNVGSDVVFGSRTRIITSDGLGSEPVTIADGAMVADRVCLLPGVHVGEQTTMGSGSLTRRGRRYEAGGTFVGSKGGDAVCLSSSPRHRLRRRVRRRSSEDTLAEPPARTRRVHDRSSDETLTGSCEPSSISPQQTEADGRVPSAAGAYASPFGRAFYLGLAPYRVLGPLLIFCYSAVIAGFTVSYWNAPSIASIQAVDRIMNRLVSRDKNLLAELVVMYSIMVAAMAVFTMLQALLALAVVVAAKWLLVGQRLPGNYDWDKSSYCQRWQLFLAIEGLRRACCRGHGVLGLLTGTHWIVLYFRAMGAKIGKDCALFANGRPSLMFTEPDLVTLGDRVAVDDASIVAHINTRGTFDLNRLDVGSRCVLRSDRSILISIQTGAPYR